MPNQSTARPATIIITDRSCHRRWAAAAAALLVLAWMAPSPLEALPKHSMICQETILCQ